MSATGWAKIHRSLVDHDLWTRERFTKGQAWVDLILMAAFKDHECFITNGPPMVKRGQVLTSQMALGKRWRWDRETVRLFLRSLAVAQMIVTEISNASATGFTLITILNYEKFQDGGETDSAILPAIQPRIDSPPARRKAGEPWREAFARFWAAYPKKRSRGDAEKAWRKMSPPLDVVLSALGRLKRSQDWLKEGGRFVRYPSTWLNSQGWLDEVAVNLSSTSEEDEE